MSVRGGWLVTARWKEVKSDRPFARCIELNWANLVDSGCSLVSHLPVGHSGMSHGPEGLQFGFRTGYGLAVSLRGNRGGEGYRSILADGSGGPDNVVFAVVVIAFQVEKRVPVVAHYHASRCVCSTGVYGVRGCADIRIHDHGRAGAMSVGRARNSTSRRRAVGPIIGCT